MKDEKCHFCGARIDYETEARDNAFRAGLSRSECVCGGCALEVSLDDWLKPQTPRDHHVTRLQSAVWGAAMDVYAHAERLDEEASNTVDYTRSAREVYRGARVVRARLALLIEAAEAAREALRPLDEEVGDD